jgi:hypothetical protein
MKDDISRKSDITRIINIKCDTNNNNNPNIINNNYNTFNLSNKISNKENEKKSEKIYNQNFNSKNNKEKNAKKEYIYDDIEKKRNFKFDFFSFGNLLKKNFDLFSDCPFPIEEININVEEFINSNKNILDDNDNMIYEFDYKNKNIYNWILSYNKILSKEKFVKENNLKNFKPLNTEFINSLLSLNFKKFIDENNINNSNDIKIFIPVGNYIMKNLTNFFVNFSLKNILKKKFFFLEIQQIYSIDSLMHIEAIDFFGNKINLAYILPDQYFEEKFISNFNNYDKKNYSDGNNNSFKNSSKKIININDVIILKSKNFNFSDNYNNERIFIEEKDFDLIYSLFILY